MPLYDYQCASCGDFRVWRRMSEAGAPVDCTNCGAAAARAVVAPNLALMNPHSRIAHQRNEKSAHEPQVVSRSRPHQGEHRHAHGHHHQHRHGASRPWMLGH
jgi:putative FmdB family regulatory protein